MKIEEYIAFTDTTAIYPQERRAEYLRLGLLSEIGEVAALHKRAIRDGVPIDRDELLKEYGDCCWYLAQMFPDARVWKRAKRVMEIPNAARHCEQLVDLLNELPNCYGSQDSAVRWFCIILQRERFTLEEVMQANYEKLSSRLERGVLHGKGGER